VYAEAPSVAPGPRVMTSAQARRDRVVFLIHRNRLKCDEALSNVAFYFNLRCYDKAKSSADVVTEMKSAGLDQVRTVQVDPVFTPSCPCSKLGQLFIGWMLDERKDSRFSLIKQNLIHTLGCLVSALDGS